ncbi:MAG: hypothetical protein PHD01_09375 [Geobacteraceae bacterium]|nr:hypothetical protein [Geobacteraceae bacterium]
MTQDTKDPDTILDSAASNGHKTEQGANKSFIVSHWRLIGCFLLVLAIAGMYLWKNVAVYRAKAQLTERAGQIITDQNKSFLRLAVVPLAWAVRTEMMGGNYNQINLYLTQLVKEQNMKGIIVAKPDGTIVVATDKKLEGTPVASVFPPSVLQEDKTIVSTQENGDIMVVSPIMGLNEKLGVLILLYTPPGHSLQGF